MTPFSLLPFPFESGRRKERERERGKGKRAQPFAIAGFPFRWSLRHFRVRRVVPFAGSGATRVPGLLEPPFDRFMRHSQIDSGISKGVPHRSRVPDAVYRPRHDDDGRPGCADDQSRRVTSMGRGEREREAGGCRSVRRNGEAGRKEEGSPPTQGTGSAAVLPSESRQPATRVLLPSF